MTTNNTDAKRKPSHRAFAVHGENDKARWIEVGAAWLTRDGKGFTLQLDAYPVGGRLVMRAIDENGGQQ